jgi:hypothetical protein
MARKTCEARNRVQFLARSVAQRRSARRRAQARAASSVRQSNRVSALSWYNIGTLLKDWKAYTSSLLSTMVCCAFCGVTCLRSEVHVPSNWKPKEFTYIKPTGQHCPYALANFFMTDFCGQARQGRMACVLLVCRGSECISPLCCIHSTLVCQGASQHPPIAGPIALSR